jgi:hypothetical protein
LFWKLSSDFLQPIRSGSETLLLSDWKKTQKLTLRDRVDEEWLQMVSELGPENQSTEAGF